MYNSDTELLFPLRVAASLSSMRGKEWQDLVERVSAPDAELTDQMGFVINDGSYGWLCGL